MTWRRSDLDVVQRQDRVVDRAADHEVRVAEVVIVVGVGAAEGDDRRDGVAATSGTTSSLLVVGPRRRHVAKRDAGQAADVDADLHRGRARQDVDRGTLLLAGRGSPTSTSWNSNSYSSALEKTASDCAALSCAVCSAAMMLMIGLSGDFRARSVLSR